MDPSQLTPGQLASTPFLPPPPGQQSNFVNPPSKAGSLTAPIVVILVLMLAVLAVRLYCKLKVVKQFGADDVSAFIAAILTAFVGIFNIIIFYGPGWAVHSWDVPLKDIVAPIYFTKRFVLQIVGPWTTYFAKLSILLFLLTIFPRKARRVTAGFIYVGIVLNTLFYVILTIFNGVVCSPRGPQAMRPSKCTDIVQLQTSQALAAINIILDLYVFVVAIASVSGLQMRNRRKIGVYAVFAIGLISVACSAVTLSLRVTEFPDPTWNETIPEAFGFYEPATAVITACLPTTLPVWQKLFSKAALSWQRLSNVKTRSHALRSSARRDSQVTTRLADRESSPSTSKAIHSSSDDHDHELYSLSLSRDNSERTRNIHETNRNMYEV